MNTDADVRVSVIVPTYKRPDLLRRCLDALGRQTLAPDDYEIIVCDDGPSEQARQVVSEVEAAIPAGPALRYLAVTGTQGPAAARNRGWQHARAPIVAFTDDDTLPDPQWLSAGLKAMSDDVDAAAGRLVVPLPDKPSDIELDAAGLSRSEFVTANCFVRRDVLEAIGGFDERFSMAWREDSDLHFRLLDGGYNLVQASDARVVHPLRDTPFGAGVGMQKKVLFDVLLYCKHPQHYRERIRHGPPWFYIFVSVLLLLTVFFVVMGRSELAAISLGGWALATLIFFLRRLSRSALTLSNAGELFITSLVIPPLSVFWRLVGISRYGVKFP